MAILLWTHQFSEAYDLPAEAKADIRHMALSVAFTADTATDATQFSFRALAAGVAMHRATWDMDSSAHSSVLSLPFKGEKLFGDSQDPLLIESKGKKKFLPARDCSPSASQSFLSYLQVPAFRFPLFFLYQVSAFKLDAQETVH